MSYTPPRRPPGTGPIHFGEDDGKARERARLQALADRRGVEGYARVVLDVPGTRWTAVVEPWAEAYVREGLTRIAADRRRLDRARRTR